MRDSEKMAFGYAGWFRLYDTAIGIAFARTSDKTFESADAFGGSLPPRLD